MRPKGQLRKDEGFYDKPVFTQPFQRDPRHRAAIRQRLGQFIGMVEHDRLLGPDARLARGLAGLFNPLLYPGIGPTLPISQEELGQLVGLSRQRVNRALKVLEERALLRIEYGAVTVLDLEGLRRFGG